MSLLETINLNKYFGEFRAVDDVSLSIADGEFLSLVGPNGAGKTTLVNLVTGFDFPDSGTVELEGEEITSWPPYRRSRAGLARTFQQGHSFRGLSVRENVEVSALGVGARAGEARRRSGELLELLGLAERAKQRAALLPHGEEHLLGVARALASEPRFLLMDEPAAGLHEGEVAEFAAVVRRLCAERKTGVLLIDHNVGLIMDVCDRIHVLDQGKTLAEGTPAEVRRNVDVEVAYLGRRGGSGAGG
jgi:branched-chain amino acid transport system ATP-binding protein